MIAGDLLRRNRKNRKDSGMFLAHTGNISGLGTERTGETPIHS
jgi:hypothetical protein